MIELLILILAAAQLYHLINRGVPLVKVWYLNRCRKQRENREVERCVAQICGGIFALCLVTIFSGPDRVITAQNMPGIGTPSRELILIATRSAVKSYQQNVIREMLDRLPSSPA